MKILLVHNYYRHRGGEDAAFDELKEMLELKGYDVRAYTRSSMEISGVTGSISSLLSIFYSFKTKRDIKKVIRDFSPDIAHIHNIYPLISRSIYDVLYKNNILVVQTIHNYRFFCANGLCLDRGKICEKCRDLRLRNIFTDCRRESRLYNFLLALSLYLMRKKEVFSKISRFIAPGGFLKDKMIETGIGADRITVIRNIIRLPEMGSINKGTNGEPYFLYLGRLSEEKGIAGLIKVLSELKEIKVRILGDGPLKEKIEEKVSVEGLDNIEIYGYVKGAEKYRILKNALAVIIPSVCYEVSPLVIMESFRMGIPVIVNNIGSMPENVIHGKNGFIYNDLEELKKVVLDIAGFDGHRKEDISIYCRESYDKLFDPELNLKELEKLYMKVVEG